MNPRASPGLPSVATNYGEFIRHCPAGQRRINSNTCPPKSKQSEDEGGSNNLTQSYADQREDPRCRSACRSALKMILSKNKKAFHDYKILDKLETGIKLTGQEVKSAKLKNISLKGAYITINYTGPNKQPEAWLLNCHIAPYKFAGKIKNYEPTRSRKLLLNKSEITKLIGLKKQKGLTFVPLSMYTKHGYIKISLGLCRGKKLFDKRQDIKKKESQRKIQRLLRQKS